MIMKAVGIRELKATLSRQIEDVKRGEVVLITDRGRVVAEIRAPGSAGTKTQPADEFEQRIRPLVESGRVTLGKPNNPGLYGPPLLHLPEGTARKWLDESREDKF